jgi:hypothetical protein
MCTSGFRVKNRKHAVVHGLKCICIRSSKHNSLPQYIFEWVKFFIILVLVQFINTYSNRHCLMYNIVTFWKVRDKLNFA